MKTISLVFSAPRMLRLCPQKWQISNPTLNKRFVSVVKAVIGDIMLECEHILPEFKCEISFLFNAHTESETSDLYVMQENYGASKIYADSGGLQMVTLGSGITPELMQEVYHVQRNSDYAMAFDEIPVRTRSAKTSLANVDGRIYMPSVAAEKARKTALNIIEQCRIMEQYERPKVMFITQGNNLQDVIEWSEIGFEYIPIDLWERKIGGFALGSPCIGSGQQESVENMIAYMTVINKYPERYKDRVHLLGYGSVSRLLPSIELFTTHFVPDGTTLTFDSTSLSMVYIMGKWTTETGKSISVSNDQLAAECFNKVLDFVDQRMKEQFPDYNRDVLLEHLVDNRMSIATTTQLDNNSESGCTAWAKCFVPCYILYQTIGLWQGIKLKMQEDNLLIRSADNCKTIAELHDWYYKHKHLFPSKRVARESSVLIEDFFV